jgi:hypothetical protein
MKNILIIVATILLALGVNCGESASLPAARNPFPPHLLAIAYLVLLDHVAPANTVSKKTVSTSSQPKPKPLIPRVIPAQAGLR